MAGMMTVSPRSGEPWRPNAHGMTPEDIERAQDELWRIWLARLKRAEWVKAHAAGG